MSNVTHAGLSDQGRVRRQNDDYWFADSEMGLYIVADGMGGAVAGGLAAKAVVEVLPKLLRQKLEGIDKLDNPRASQRVLAALAEMSDRLQSEGSTRFGAGGVGSTVALVLLRDRFALVAHMGDSRVYLLRRGQLEQLTKDHSIVQLLLDNHEITPEEAATHPARAQLTRYVGMQGESLPEARLMKLAAADRLLLCTDGLSGMVSDPEVLSILEEQSDPEAACRELVAAANEAGGKDNVTALVVSIGDLPGRHILLQSRRFAAPQ